MFSLYYRYIYWIHLQWMCVFCTYNFVHVWKQQKATNQTVFTFEILPLFFFFGYIRWMDTACASMRKVFDFFFCFLAFFFGRPFDVHDMNTLQRRYHGLSEYVEYMYMYISTDSANTQADSTTATHGTTYTNVRNITRSETTIIWMRAKPIQLRDNPYVYTTLRWPLF